MKKMLIVIYGIFFACVSTCCTIVGLFKSDTETRIDLDGKVILKDTQIRWEIFTAIMDGEIQRELTGNRPPGGHLSWNDRWLGSVKSLRLGNQENHEKYVDYIISTRRRIGLRDLKGL